METKLKIGFVIPGTKQLPAWYYETIKEAAAINNVQVHFLILKDIEIQLLHKSSFAFRLFQSFENWWFVSKYDADKMINAGHLLNENNTSVIIVKNSFFIADDESYRELQLQQFDIIYTIHFDDHAKENLSELAAYGLWYIKFGYKEYFNLIPTAFSEVMDDNPIIGSYLLSRKNNADTLIYEGTTTVVPYSVKNTFHSIAWKSSSYLPNRINGLLQCGENFLSGFHQFLPKQNLKNVSPDNFRMLFLFIRNFIRYIIFKIEKQREGSFTLFLSYESFDFQKSNKFKPVHLPKTHFFADPFLIEKDNIHYIFFEQFIVSQNKAHISVIEVAAGKISSPRIVLDKPYHLSYPFVFYYDGEHYMVPETSANNTVELYRAKQFPYEWEFVMHLIKGKSLIDVTLHFENGFWWMFANSRNHSFVSTNDQLFLFYSKDLFSTDWKSHCQNPVVTHIDNCRPAGRLFRQNGKLYRPAQNNASKQYGYGLKINEVIALNEDKFEEKEIYTIDIEQLNVKACHHIDFTNNLTVVDGILK